MAGTLQSNQYDPIRRIGYSVGLEDPVDRIDKLVNLYVNDQDISLASWKNLVKEVYGRKISDDLQIIQWGGNKKTSKKLGAEIHFADFYSELNLIIKKGNQIFPGYGLEILSILRRYFKNDDVIYFRAIKSLILLFIIEADGDIFVNCLLANFDKDETKEKLVRMFNKKKETYLGPSVGQYLRSKMAALFKVQTSNVQESAFQRKSIITEEFEIPQDYISKVIPTRKGWANQLEVFSKGLESSGRDLIEFLTQKDIVKDGFCTFYSYSEVHQSMFVDEQKLGIPILMRKDFIRDFFQNYFHRDFVTSNLEREEIYNILAEVMQLYKKGNKNKGVLRHQLPLRVAIPTFYIITNLKGFSNVNLNDFLESEQKSPDRKMDIINLRGIDMEGAISFRQ